MSLLNVLLGRNDDGRIERLEKKVEELEAVLLEVTLNIRKLAALSIRLGEEVDNLAQHVKSKEMRGSPTNQMKKTDDFYN